MFPDLGNINVSLTIDLSAYEDDWRHVSAFRGQNGWLLMAKATIQSAAHSLSATLLAACDDQENAIPSWRARHLTECAWSDLDYCHEEPPGIIDDLMCEEEGALYARWQRETNTALAALHDKNTYAIEALEAGAQSQINRVERMVDELRRQRRFSLDVEHRTRLNEAIGGCEQEMDHLLDRLSQRRADLHREADVAEEALWQREEILFEIEPIRLVRWRDGGMKRDVSIAQTWRQGSFYAPSACADSNDPCISDLTMAIVVGKRKRQNAPVATTIPTPLNSSIGKHNVMSQLTLRTKESKAWVKPEQAKPKVENPRPQIPASETYAEVERSILADRVAALNAKSLNFHPNSPKYKQSLGERERLLRRIKILDREIIKQRRLASIGPEVTKGVNPPMLAKQEALLRQLWAQGNTPAQIALVLEGMNSEDVVAAARQMNLPPPVNVKQDKPS